MAELTRGAFLPPPPVQNKVRQDPVQNRVNTVRFVIFMLHRLSDTKAWMLTISFRHAYSIGQMQILYSRPPSHDHECDFILVRCGPFEKVGRSKALPFTQGYRNKPSEPVQNRFKFGWYGKVNQKSGRFANVPFHSHMNKKGRSSSGPLSGPAGFSTDTRKCISLTLSQYIGETLFFCRSACCFLFLDTNF